MGNWVITLPKLGVTLEVKMVVRLGARQVAETTDWL
jgi:hypothetical protein